MSHRLQSPDLTPNLRTLPAIEEELRPETTPFVFDLPRPQRDDDISPELAFVYGISRLLTRGATPVEPDGWTSIPDKSK